MTTTRSTESIWAYHRRKQQEPKSPKTIQLRNTIVMDNINLIREIAHRWADQCPEPFEDLVQIGVVGAVKAAERFDPNKGVAFSSFAVPYIQGAIQHHLRDHWGTVKVPRRSFELAGKVRQSHRHIVAAGRVDITEERMAQAMGVDKGRWRWTAEAVARQPVVSLDELHMPVDDDNDIEVETDTESLRQSLYSKLGELPDPYQSCIVERFFKRLNDEAIAKRHRVNVAQVEIWIEEGLRQLRHKHPELRNWG
jgi:RNA polymerase sigma-B factor